MTKPFALRSLGALDLDCAVALHRAAFAPLGERTWTRQDVAELLASPGVGGLLLRDDSVDIGFALFRAAADEAELLTIAVHPGYRRLGAGRALLDAIVERARGAGAGALFLEVGEDNPAARTLYEQRGFSTVGRRAAYYRRGERAMADALIMRLALVSPNLKPGG